MAHVVIVALAVVAGRAAFAAAERGVAQAQAAKGVAVAVGRLGASGARGLVVVAGSADRQAGGSVAAAVIVGVTRRAALGYAIGSAGTERGAFGVAGAG